MLKFTSFLANTGGSWPIPNSLTGGEMVKGPLVMSTRTSMSTKEPKLTLETLTTLVCLYPLHLPSTHQHPARESPLSSLPYAQDAPFNSFAKRHDPICLPDTRVNVLRDIYSWADGRDERCIFWLSGLAGTGKSIARTVARRYFDQKRLGASFFFSRGGGEVGHAGRFVTSIALQLASSIPYLNQYVCDAIKEHRNIASQSPRD
jgi:hypothetical protein